MGIVVHVHTSPPRTVCQCADERGKVCGQSLSRPAARPTFYSTRMRSGGDLVCMCRACFEGRMSGTPVQSLPCRIRVDGGTRNASAVFFESSIRNGPDGRSASLRGRPLRHVELQVPAGYRGVVVKQTGDHHSPNSSELTECRRFCSIDYWTLGSAPPSSDNVFGQALTWTHLSQSIHTQLAVDEQ